MSQPRRLHLPFIAKAAGVSFFQDNARQCVVGDALVVRREPDNPYDANAFLIQRTRDGAIVGHLPGPLALRLAQEDTQEFPAVVAEVLAGQTWGLRVEVGTSARAFYLRNAPAGHCPVEGEDDLKPSRVASQAQLAAPAPTTTNEVSDQMNATTPVEPSPPPVIVRALSGRELGYLLARSEGKVWVRSSAGHEVGYPEDVVTVAA